MLSRGISITTTTIDDIISSKCNKFSNTY